ncbi:MAG: ABC transporter permease [Candidatus Desulforudis sp.]|nr:ABC transporter permease [Desulforudis sp.]
MHIDYQRAVTSSFQGRTGGIILGVVAVTALCGPALVGSPATPSPAVLQPPSAAYPLGTNDFGQDLFAQLVHGARLSLAVALGAGLLTVLTAALIGGAAGLARGWADTVLMRLTDAVLAMPAMVVIIVIAAYFQLGPAGLVLVITLFGWPGTARVVRAQTLTLRNKPHVLAARTFGAPGGYVLYRHILPDLAPILVVGFLQSARRAVFLEAGLAFLGIGDPTIVSWGAMIQGALRFFYLDAWLWWLLPPALAIAATILSFTLLGNILEALLDPRLREVRHA